MTESYKDYLAICILVVVAGLVLSAVIACGMFPFFAIFIGVMVAIAGLVWAIDRVSDF